VSLQPLPADSGEPSTGRGTVSVDERPASEALDLRRDPAPAPRDDALSANAIHRGPDDRLHRRARPGDRAPRTSSPAFSSVAALDAIETKYERKGKRVEIVGLDRASADRHGRLSGRLP